MSLRVVLILAAALGLAGCESAVKVPDAAPGRIVLRPTDAVYRVAVDGLSSAERDQLKKGLGFTIDTLLAAPTAVETMKWSHARADTPSVVEISSFVRFLDLQPAVKGPVRVNLAWARVSAGVTHESDTFTPVFKIQAEVEPSSTAVTTVTAIGNGLVCKRAGEAQLGSPELAASEQVAFMRALVRMLLKVSVQIQQAPG